MLNAVSSTKYVRDRGGRVEEQQAEHEALEHTADLQDRRGQLVEPDVRPGVVGAADRVARAANVIAGAIAAGP